MRWKASARNRVPSRRFRPQVVRGAQLVLAFVFLVAGLAKVGNLEAFAGQIHNFRMIPVWSENVLAMVLPWIEILAGISLLLGVERRAGAWIVAGLMVVFTLGVAQAWMRGLDIECGCFGTGDATRVGLTKLVENVGLTTLAAIAILRPRS
jgi:uncharacterized membrane protein YphA (DoxX/SURF4 family)